MKNQIIKFAFFLLNSKKYNRVKKFVHDILENSEYAYKKYLDFFLITLIMVSVGELVYGISHSVPLWLKLTDLYVISGIFLIEYLLRFWVYSDIHKDIIKKYEKSKFLKSDFSIISSLGISLKKKFNYMISPTAIIDLLAIAPIYREIRILRIFKLFRYTKSINQFVDVIVVKKFELMTLLMLLMFLISTGAIAIYVFEAHINKNINSLFDAFYWALITSATVGYGDISPVTTAGRVISMLIVLGGLVIISFATSVIVSAFYEKLTEIKEKRMIENINKEDFFVIICGYGQMTKMLLRQNNFNNKYVILEKDPDVTKQITKEGFNAITEDASRHDVLAKFNTKYAKVSVLCLGKSDVENIYITLNAKSLGSHINVIARASDESMEKKFLLAGANHVIMPNRIANVMLLTAINQPVMYSAMHSILAGDNAAYLDEIMVLEHDSLMGRQISEINFKEKKLLLIGIKNIKHGFVFNPSADTILTPNDILLIMGLKISIEYFSNKARGIQR